MRKFCKLFLGLLAILLLNFAFPSQGWANSDYYCAAKAQISSNSSGRGKVYISKTSTKSTSVKTEEWQESSMSVSWDKKSASSTPMASTAYVTAKANDGYYFQGWGDKDNATNKGIADPTTLSASWSTNASQTTTYYATFGEVTVDDVSGNDVLNPTSRTEAYEGIVTFGTANGTAKADFNNPSFTATSGTGTFDITNYTWLENVATVNYSFKGNGKRGDNSGTLTFSSLSGSSQSITITANYLAITIAAGEAAEILPSTPTTPTQGTATFAVTNAGADDDFATPVISGAAAGDTWTIDSWGYADNVVTVNYTFTGNGDLDTHTATLTLSEAAYGNDASNSVTLSADVIEVATQDASVTDNGVTIKYDTWAQALAAANASSNNPTIKLLRDVSGISVSQSITKSMTIDLNRYTLSGTANKMLNINGTGISVTITDSKNGGTIAMTTSAVAKASTVYITKGSLTLDNATIEATNNYGTASSDARAIAVWVDVNGTFVMNSGELKGTTAQDYAYGLYSYGTTTINGGTLTAMAALKSRGMCLYQGTTTINGGEINATTTSGAEAVGVYMYTGNSKYGTLTTTGGTINVSSATTTAYGIYPNYAGNTITASDLTINVVAEHTTAYGVYMPAASTTSLTNCTINVEGKGVNLTAANTVNAMGVYAYKTGGNVTLDHCTINAQVTKPSYGRYAYGVNAVAGVTTTIQNNCSITATSDYQYAYGVYNAGSLIMTNSNATATTNGAAYAYGVYSKGTPNIITGNTINASSYTTYGYGVFIEKASSENTINNNNIQVEVKASTTTSATASVYAYGVYLNKSGTLTMEGNTVYAECTKEGMGRNVYGVKFDSGTLIATLRNNHITAVAPYDYAYGIYNCATMTSENDEALGKTITSNMAYGIAHVQTNPAYDLNITGGTFTGQTMASSTSYGMYVNYGKVTATGTTFNANSYTTNPRGVWGDVSLNTYTLAKYYADITLTNCTVNATSQTASTSYGLYLNAAARENNEGTWNALSADNKTKYAETYKMGTEAVAAQAVVNNCTITATSYTATAYGIYAVSRPYQTSNLYSPGETILDVRPTLTINGGIYKAVTLGSTTAAGMYTGGNTTVTGGTFIGEPKTTTGYGINVADGTLTANGTTIQVSGTGTLYGVCANASLGNNNFIDGKIYQGHADLTDVNVTVTATAANAYAVYAHTATQHQDEASYNALSADNKKTYTPANYVYGDWTADGSATIHSGTYTVNSSSTNAYAIYSISKVTSTITGISSIVVHDGKFKTSGTSSCQDAMSTGKMVIEGGYFSKMDGVSDFTIEGYSVYPLESNHPLYSAGYRYEIDALRYGDAICKNGSKEYLTLEAALEDVNNGTVNGGTIEMLLPYTLPAGNYIIPKGCTLLIPYKTNQGKAIGDKSSNLNHHTAADYGPWIPAYSFRKLTFESGVNMQVYGTIEASAQQHCMTGSNNGTNGATSSVNGPYGELHLKAGATITLNTDPTDRTKGGILRAWGYVTGGGEIIAQRGATVREMFQVSDWKGGTVLKDNGFANGSSCHRVFPINQYYIQNVQVPTIYRPGSHLKTSFHMTAKLISASIYGSDDVNIVGEYRSASDKDVAMFLMNTATDDMDTWVRKEFDAENDLQIYTISSSAYLSAMTIPTGITGDITSSGYDLPITNNMKVIVDNGTLEVTENMVMLPGSEIEIMHDANLIINAGKHLSLYDNAEWSTYAYSGKYTQTVPYCPEWKVSPRPNTLAAQRDAAINVHGTIQVDGFLFTTEGGANIYSNNKDAGHVIFPSSTAAGKQSSVTVSQWKSSGFVDAPYSSAKLRNEGDEDFTLTDGAANGKDYCYSDGRWQCWEKVGCFQVDKSDDANWKWYGQPSDFVLLKPNAEDNHTAPALDEDHLYPSADETRFFILLDDCMWREVSLVDDGLVYCEDKDTYYEWNDTQSQWEEKYFSVVWKNWDNSVLNTYNYVKYNTMPKWLSATPTKNRQASDPVGSYWNFIGWTPEFDYVKSDQEYTATYELVVPKYDVKWMNEDGSKTLYISRWAETEHPSYEGPEIKKATSVAGIDLAHNGWSTGANGTGTRYGLMDELPAMGTTAQTYYATFAEGYIITWKNENGDVLDSKLWATGTRPTHEEIIKESNEQYDYVFAGWTPEILPVEADAEYTAVFTPVLRQYAITFSNLNGKGSSQIVYVNYGATPICPVTPDRGNSAEYSYEWTGWKDAAGNTFGTDYVFPVVSGDATYTATFSQTTRTYTVTWKNEDGTILERVRGLAIGDAVPDYSAATPQKEPTRYLIYNFTGWTPAVKATIDAEGDQEYRATYDAGSTRYYTISWLMDNGDLIDESHLEYDQMPTHTDPTKASTALYSYDFAGWAPAISAVKGDAEYKATFNAIHRQYEITYVLYDDVKNVVRYQAEDEVEIPADPTREGYTFAGWDKEIPTTMPAEDMTITATWTPGNTTYLVEYYKLHINDSVPFKQRYSYTEYPAQTGDVVTPEPIEIDGYVAPKSQKVTVAGDGSTVVKYYYKISETNTLKVESDTKTITTETEAYTVVLEPGKTLNITGAGSVTAQNLVLQSIPGENTGANLTTTTGLDIIGDVCIEIEMNSTRTMDDKLFYCFSVPFKVNVADGVERLNETNDNWESAELNTNYRVYTYNEYDRATNGRQDSNWKEFSGTQFLPGVFYLCEFDNSNYNRYRFYAANKSQLDNKGSITVFKSFDNEDAGWNGVANNGLTDNKLSGDDDDDFTIIQILNSVSNSFESATASETPMAIGNAAMVQVNAIGSVLVGETSSAVTARRMGEAASTEFINVRLYKENQDKHVDQIFIRASEDAAEQYVAGIDLSKATMGTPKVARLWVNDYDLQLVANEALMTNDQAIFSLGMSAPANGEYTIAIDNTPNDAIVYLTMNGSAIWNLNIAPAPISLSKGTENSYGLRLVRKINNVVTSLDEAVLNGNVQKVILNDHLYIIRDGKVYSAHGHVIK